MVAGGNDRLGGLEGLFFLGLTPNAQQKAMPIATAIAGDRTELLAVPLDHDLRSDGEWTLHTKARAGKRSAI